MTIELRTYTVADLHAQLQVLMDRGLGTIPVCTSDGRARYPFQAYTVLNQSHYTDALLISVRPDAHFRQRDPLPINWHSSRVQEWNDEADTIKQSCGAFADRLHEFAPAYHVMKTALEKIWNMGHPDAGDHMPEQRTLTEAQFGDRLVQIAGHALGRR